MGMSVLLVAWTTLTIYCVKREERIKAQEEEEEEEEDGGFAVDDKREREVSFV